MKTVSTHQLGTNALKILVYGESGSGKTTLAGTIDEPTLIVSAEAGLLSLAAKQIDVTDITQADDGSVVPREGRIARLRQILMELHKKEVRDKYRWIFIDSLTEISQYVIDELKSLKKYEDPKMALQMYGENKAIMRGLVKAFRDLPYYNVVFTALPTIEKDENARRFYQVDVIGSIATELPAMFDEVFFLNVIEGAEGRIERVLVTGKTGMITAKDRSGKLDLFEKPNLGAISQKIKGERK